jgi:hypothetical protein
MDLTAKIALASSSGVGTTGQVCTVVVTGKTGVRSFAFAYEGVPLPATKRSFLRQPSPSDVLVVAIGSPGAVLDWQIVDANGTIIMDAADNPAKQSTRMPIAGPAYDGITI